ncbi:MAG: CBS domain-containing protein [Nanoarchaeota archaeon]
MLERCTLIEPFYCGENDSVIDVAKKLRTSTLRQLFVVNEQKYPVGVISTTDINNRVVAEGKDPHSLQAKDIMSKPIEVYDIHMDATDVYREMRDRKRLMCAVVDRETFMGMVTLGEVFKHVATQ